MGVGVNKSACAVCVDWKKLAFGFGIPFFYIYLQMGVSVS